MDTLAGAGLGARRNEDIALDLLKFVTVTAGVARPNAPSTGFVSSAASKPEDQVSHLLDLYTRPKDVKGASITLHQQVRRGDEVLVEADVQVAFVSGGRAKPIPKPLRMAMKADQEAGGPA